MDSLFAKIKERLEERRGIAARDKYESKSSDDRYYYQGADYGYYKAIEIVNQVAEEVVVAENATANDGWIPCSVRLPETEEMCWITYEDADGKLHVGEDIYCDYGGWYETEDTAVKAWMYVNAPAPYKPKGERV